MGKKSGWTMGGSGDTQAVRQIEREEEPKKSVGERTSGLLVTNIMKREES